MQMCAVSLLMPVTYHPSIALLRVLGKFKLELTFFLCFKIYFVVSAWLSIMIKMTFIVSFGREH